MSIVRGRCARVAAGGALVVLSLSGCSTPPASPPVTSAPLPTPSPLFASDDEALAAAKKAYEAFTNMSDLILAQGGRNAGRIRHFASESVALSEMAGYERARSRGWHSTGKSNFDNVTVQDVNVDARKGVAVLTVYLCSDVSGTDVLDSTGKSVVSPSRHARLPFLVTFDLKEDGEVDLVVGSKELWQGDGVC